MKNKRLACNMQKLANAGGKQHDHENFVAYTIPSNGFQKLVAFAVCQNGMVEDFSWVHKDFQK